MSNTGFNADFLYQLHNRTSDRAYAVIAVVIDGGSGKPGDTGQRFELLIKGSPGARSMLVSELRKAAALLNAEADARER